MEEYFVPKVNKVAATKIAHTKADLKQQVYVRLQKDLNMRKVKEMLREEQKIRTTTLNEIAKMKTIKIGNTRTTERVDDRCRNRPNELQAGCSSQDGTLELSTSKICGPGPSIFTFSIILSLSLDRLCK